MPSFHALRDVRAGKPTTRVVARESAWSHANHLGYLTACETHATSALERATGNQLTLLKRFAAAWESRDRSGLFRLLPECEAYFDPQKPSALVHFTGLGGIDLFARLICDNAEWLVFAPQGVVFYHHQDEGINVYNTMLRVLTELLVCHNDIGWYIYDRHRSLMLRLIELIRVEKLRDSAIMLLEHLISVVGPVLHIPTNPMLAEVIRSMPDAGLACVSRVLALLVVPGVMTDQIWRSKRLEPFPQCLIRIRKIQQVVDDNVKWIIECPNLITRLLKLAQVRSSGVRIFQGNRTVTVMAPPEPSEMAHHLPAGIAPAASVEAIMQQLTQWTGMMAQQNAANQQAAAAAGLSPPAPTSPNDLPPFMTMDVDDDDDYMDADDNEADFDAVFEGYPIGHTQGGGAPSATEAATPMTLTADMMQNPAALQQALQQILLQSAGGTNSAAAAAQQQPPAAAAAGGGGGGGGGAGSVNQQTLQSFAESLSQDMLPVNSLDSINFSWFCGRPDTKSRWRFHSMRVTPADDDRTSGLLVSKQNWDMRGSDFLSRLMKQEADRRRMASTKQRSNMEAAEQQAIVNSQSEVFFVLNSIMVTTHYTQAWHALTRVHVLEKCHGAFDFVFFINSSSTSIHASPPAGLRSNTGRNGLDVPAAPPSQYESADEVRLRKEKFYEAYWNHPTLGGSGKKGALKKGTTTGTKPVSLANSAHGIHNGVFANEVAADEAPTSFVVASAAGTYDASSDDGDDSDMEDNGDHRHDPDTLRKLELLRIVHEYCNAQDREESSRLLHEPSVVSVKDDLALKMADQLCNGTEDACTETVAAHALEALVRCTSFGQPMDARELPSTLQNVLADRLVPHLIERIYNAVKSAPGGSPHALLPAKRVDAVFALLGELCKYNPRGLLMLQEYMTGERRVLAPSAPASTAPASSGAAPSASPTSLGPHGGGDGAALVMARGDDEPFLSVLRYRLRRFGIDTNLFIRSIALSLTPGLTVPVNYVWKPLQACQGCAVPTDAAATATWVQDVIASMQDARSFLPSEQRTSESSTVQMHRIYYIRRNSRAFIEALVANPAEAAATNVGAHREEGIEHAERVQRQWEWWCEALDVIQRAPKACAADARPFSQLFSTGELALLRPGAPLPRAGLAPAVRARLLQGGFIPASEAAQMAQLGVLDSELFGNPAELIYNMVCGLSAESMENTERLCVVTSSILIFLRASFQSGQSGVDAVLSALEAIATPRSEHRRAVTQRHRRIGVREPTTTGGHAEPPCRQCRCCGVDTPLDQQCENFVVFGDCKPRSTVDDYFDAHGTDFFKNYFRLLCIWLCHYACSQRYVETLYYCSGVPFGEWKVIALYLWREVPNYFTRLD